MESLNSTIDFISKTSPTIFLVIICSILISTLINLIGDKTKITKKYLKVISIVTIAIIELLGNQSTKKAKNHAKGVSNDSN